MSIKDKGYDKIIAGLLVGGAIYLLGHTLITRNVYTEPCNGHVELCDRRVDEVAFATTHNAMSIADYDWFGPSHENSVTDQLNSGVRGLMLDTHYYDAVESIASYFPEATKAELLAMEAVVRKVDVETKDGVFMCHIICQLGSTPMGETLTEIKQFLDNNPREVIVIIFEDRIDKDDSVDEINESGLTPYLYTHTGDDWPKLGELIEDNTRLIIMSEFERPEPDWYHHAWDQIEETPYSFREEVEEAHCIPNRGDTDKDLFLLNHWVERVVPRRSDAAEVNEYDLLLGRALNCAEIRGHEIPNFVAVNFSKEGDVFEVVDTLNGVAQQ